MLSRSSRNQIDILREAAQHIGNFDAIVEAVRDSDARFVLIGEASHGTHDFYAIRAAITRRLIQECGFSAVVGEADWPHAYRVNRYINLLGSDNTAEEALRGFERFPQWMWRNQDVVEFVNWLRDWNGSVGDDRDRCGFYGMDLYSLFDSVAEVVSYLEKVDPEAARKAKERYACFEGYNEDTQAYGYAAHFNLDESCEQGVIQQLLEMQRNGASLNPAEDGRLAADEFFRAEQNARLVKNAEEYYRSMFGGRVSSWNMRDQHMAETLENLCEHLTAWNRRPARMVVWAHNSHLGDCSATQMARMGEFNVGQLVRERYQQQAVLVGFTTYTGSVTAARDWDGDAERRNVRKALNGSYEELLHRVGKPSFLLNFRDQSTEMKAAINVLQEERLERAIGVIYRPESERLSHYFDANLTKQFDVVMHLDETSALVPLEKSPQWHAGEPPETYPFAV
ncbi:MAG TPA: erythromycin esterase family protein [Terriglobales bacterium]